MLFLMPRLPPIRDLRQQGSDSFNIGVTPKTSADAADFDEQRNRNFLISNVAVHAGKANSQSLSRLASRIALHSG